MLTIGQTLAEARRKAGLSVEDAAHATRIHPNMILYIEEDDYALFASVAYAKGFIRSYAAFLEVDVQEALESLNPGISSQFSEPELLDGMKDTVRKHGQLRYRLRHALRALRRRFERPGKAPIVLNLVLVTLTAALLVFYFLGFETESPDEAKSEIVKGLQSANPFSTASEQEDPAPGELAEADEIGATGETLPPWPLAPKGGPPDPARAKSPGQAAPSLDLEALPPADPEAEAEPPGLARPAPEPR